MRGGIITAQLGPAIHVDGLPIFVTNDGQLSSGAGGSSDSDGIRVMSVGGEFTVSNPGIIDTYGNDSDGISVNVSSFEDTAINNSGFITTLGDNANAFELSGPGSYTATNSGQLTTTGIDAHGIALVPVTGSGNSALINEGTVTSAGVGASAIFVSTITGINTEIINTNNGTLTGSAYAVQTGAGNEVLSNFGNIVGRVDLAEGDDTFRRQPNSTVTGVVSGGSQRIRDLLDVGFNGDEQLDGAQFIDFEFLAISGTGSITMTSDHVTETTTVISGTLTIDDGVTLHSAQTNVFSGGKLNGNGTVSGDIIAQGGEVDIGESIGSLIIGGDLTVDSGTLTFEADSPTSQDLLTVGGNVTLTNATVRVLLGYTPEQDEILDFMNIGGGFDAALGFNNIVGIAQAGSGVALGTEFMVSFGGQQFDGVVTSVVPIPAGMWLLGSGLVAMMTAAARRRKKTPGSDSD